MVASNARDGRLTMMMRCVGLLLLLLLVQSPRAVWGHGAMLNPPPRNAIDSTIPGMNWGNGSTRTGHLEPLGVGCANGTEPCKPGQAVFWFSQGCKYIARLSLSLGRRPATLPSGSPCSGWRFGVCFGRHPGL